MKHKGAIVTAPFFTLEKGLKIRYIFKMNAAYRVELEVFEGPLDLLLSLIEKRKLHINDVSLAKITDDFLLYIEKLGKFPVRDTADFILVASTLVLIKSRSLLPVLQLTPEEEENIHDLEIRLKIYRRIKELGVFTERLFGKNVIFFREPLRHYTPVFSPTEEITMARLLESVKDVLHKLPRKEAIPQLVLKKVISLEEMIEGLSKRIAGALHVSFGELAREKGARKTDIIVSFLAMLELIRRGIVIAKQENHLSDIIIEKMNS